MSSVVEQTPYNEYTGDGVATVYPYEFQLLSAGDLVVTIDGVVIPSSDFVLTGVGVQAGGDITFSVAPANLTTVLLSREIALQRDTDYQYNGDLKEQTVDNDFNRIWQAMQGLYARVRGAIRLPYPEVSDELPSPAERAGFLLGFDVVTGAVTMVTAAISSALALALQLASSIGATLIGYIQIGTGAVVRRIQDHISELPSVLDYIPTTYHADIKSYTQSAVDLSPYFNACAKAHRRYRIPAGRYRVLKPINHTARRHAFNYWGTVGVGDGRSQTLIDGYTGQYPIVDCTGNQAGGITDVALISDNPNLGLGPADCASIGIKMGRGNVSTTCNEMFIRNVGINLTSDMTRNGGTGTVGICNHACEHIRVDGVSIYANLPLVSHNTMQFTPAFSSNLPTIGVEYEQPYVGAAVSNTVHTWANMILVSYDTFRAAWFQQAAHVEMPACYTSTRYLVDTTPSYAETFYFQDCGPIYVRVYQEVSGLFGATYRMDSRYLTLAGTNDGLDILIRRGAGDMGFALPGAASSSIHLENGAYLSNSNIDCNYLLGIYNASGDNNGFAALPITFTGTPNFIRNCKFTLDNSTSHTADIYAAIGPYCVNVESVNYLNAARLCTDPRPVAYTPTLLGQSTPGTPTYTGARVGSWTRISRFLAHFTARVATTAHTGTGFMAVSLPFVSGAYDQTFPVEVTGYNGGANKTLIGYVPAGTSYMWLIADDMAAGANTILPIQAAITVTVTGVAVTAS